MLPEDRIWDVILTNAKKKLDYKTLVEIFSPVDPDPFILMVIEGYARGEKKEALVLKLSREISLKNYDCTPHNAEIFIHNTAPRLEKEINARKNAQEMIDKKVDLATVFHCVLQSLKN